VRLLCHVLIVTWKNEGWHLIVVYLATVVDLWHSDQTWFSSVEDCHWLSIVSQCLTVANKVAEDIDENQQTIILQGKISFLSVVCDVN
jgi:Myotubularin-like phosphatase domain